MTPRETKQAADTLRAAMQNFIEYGEPYRPQVLGYMEELHPSTVKQTDAETTVFALRHAADTLRKCHDEIETLRAVRGELYEALLDVRDCLLRARRTHEQVAADVIAWDRSSRVLDKVAKQEDDEIAHVVCGRGDGQDASKAAERTRIRPAQAKATAARIAKQRGGTR